jgi:predicted DNA-binding transcriptional regulator AlpA
MYSMNMDVHQDARQALSEIGELASQADLARRWGLTRQRVHQLVREPAFPSPVARVSGQSVWLAHEADYWLRLRGQGHDR